MFSPMCTHHIWFSSPPVRFPVTERASSPVGGTAAPCEEMQQSLVRAFAGKYSFIRTNKECVDTKVNTQMIFTFPDKVVHCYVNIYRTGVPGRRTRNGGKLYTPAAKKKTSPGNTHDARARSPAPSRSSVDYELW